VIWLETALDAEFSLIGTRRADAGLGWLTAGPEALPAPLEVMVLEEFEPQVWIPATHAAAHHGTISLDELAGLEVIHGPRRAQAGTLRRVDQGAADSRPALRIHRPAFPALAAHDAGLCRDRRPARSGPDRPQHRRGQPGPAHPAISPADTCGMIRVSLQHHPLTASAALSMERRPAPPAAADALRDRGQPDAAKRPPRPAELAS